MNSILKTIDRRELGSELRKARERRGLTQQDAAVVIDAARTTITAIEKGERSIKSTELIKLARAYGRDEGEFLRQERPKTEPFRPQFRAAHRQRTDAIESEVIDQLEELARNYFELEQIANKPLPYKYPSEYKVGGLNVEQAAESVAYEERKRLGLGDGPIALLRDILEREVGLRIFYLYLKPTSYAAMYIYDQQLGGCIAVNKAHPVARQRWSLAHEYAHFLAHRYHADIFDESYQRLPEKERFADAFASYFLMPASGLMRQVRDAEGKISPADLCTWANYYGVSVQALTLRLEAMKVLYHGTWDELTDSGFRVHEAQSQLGLDPIPENAERLPLRYQYLAVEALDIGAIGEGQFTKFLGVSRIKARKTADTLRQINDDDTARELDLAQLLRTPEE